MNYLWSICISKYDINDIVEMCGERQKINLHMFNTISQNILNLQPAESRSQVIKCNHFFFFFLVALGIESKVSHAGQVFYHCAS